MQFFMFEKSQWKPFLRAVWFEILEERAYTNVRLKFVLNALSLIR